MGKKIAHILPHATLVIINNRKHDWLLHKVENNEFLEALKEFLNIK